jgi:hypothetical protein
VAVSQDFAMFVEGARRIVAATPDGARELDVSPPDEDASIADVTVDPAFAVNRFVFVGWRRPAAPAQARAEELEVVRYRLVDDRLGEAAVAIQGIALQDRSSARLDFGPDGKLYLSVSISDGAGARSAILRFNPDGSTPREHANASPVFATAPSEITAMAWHPVTHDLWVAGRGPSGGELRVYDSVETASFDRLPQGGVRASGDSRVLGRGRGETMLAFPPAAPGEPVRLLLGTVGDARVAAVNVVEDRTLTGTPTVVSEVPGQLTTIDAIDSDRVFLLFREPGNADAEWTVLGVATVHGAIESRLP